MPIELIGDKLAPNAKGTIMNCENFLKVITNFDGCLCCVASP